MSQQVSKTDDIFLAFVVVYREEMPQVVREDLVPADIGRFAQRLHPMQDIASVHGSSIPRDKDRPAVDTAFSAVFAQVPAQTKRQQDFSGFPLEGYQGAPGVQALGCDELELADPDPGISNRLHNEADLDISFILRGIQKTVELSDCKLLFLTPEGSPLCLEGQDAALRPVYDLKERIEGRNHGIGTGQPVLFPQYLLELQHSILCDLPVPADPAPKSLHIPDIFADRCSALFQLGESDRESLHDPLINVALHIDLP